MKNILKISLFTLTLFLLAACQQQEAAPEESIDLAGTNWILSSLNGNLPLPNTVVSLQFGADSTVSGTDGCNRYSTSFTQDGPNLTINQPAASTMMACSEPIMNQAAAYMTALTQVTSFIAAGSQLSLSSGDQVLATFVAGTEDAAASEPVPEESVDEAAPGDGPIEATGDLAGSSWTLTALNDAPPAADTTVYLQFGTDGTISGSDGCNQFNTVYSQDAGNLTIAAQSGIGTLMACPDEVMAQAAAVNAMLAETTTFSRTETELFLQNGDQVLATFELSTSDLAGTAWEVTSYNNGRDAVVGLLLGTEISANFGTDGDLAGNAGCNQYFTSYTADEGTIEIGQVGSTMRYCTEPVGVMEQESEFLAALESATTYSIRGDVLEMRTAEDQIALWMTKKVEIDLPAPAPAVPTGRVTAPQGLNIRSGPGVNFPVIGFAQNGDEGEIVGRSADSRWWAAAVPSAPDGIGWASADFILATNVENVPVIEVAPPLIVVPTSAPTPTPAPLPTATPAPQISFGADQTNIQQGQCTTLRWSVENIQAVWVYPQGQNFQNFPRTGQGSEQVCPTSTTTYEMRVLQTNGAVIFRQVTVNVAGPAATATSAPAGDPLAGTSWNVANYNNGRGGVVSVLNGTTLTLSFGTDGQLTGSAGCNNYFTSYQVTGSNITIGFPGSGQLLCTEPEGIMEQEAEFQAALQSTATFSVNGGRLEMRTAGDQIAIVAN